MPVALDRVRYFGEHLSDNIIETPEGYRICKNAVIGRSGFQTYKVAEIADPDGLLADRRPDEEIELWRDPGEVFSPATLASFEGKTFTITHPDSLLDPDSEQEHHVGHIQNVRKGSELLESGDIPLLADIIVTHKDAIRAIDSGERELSCGYKYRLAREGYRYDQRQILGNHVALVPKGRAGAEARINDAAPTKETPVKITDRVRHILGLGIQTYSKDAKPEDLASAVAEIGAFPTRDKVKYEFVRKGPDGIDLFMAIALDDAGEIQGPTEAMDRKKRLHDALDRMMADAEKQAEEKEKMDDASVQELTSLLNNFLGEKEKESVDSASEADDAHPEGCRCQDCMDARDAAAKDAEEKEKKEKEGEADDAEIVRPEPVLPANERPQSQMDSASAQRMLGLMNGLKPLVAKAKNDQLTKAFDKAIGAIRAAAKGTGDGTGSYGAVRTAAATLNDAAKQSANGETDAQRQAREFDAKMLKFREDGKKQRIASRRR